MALYAQNLGTSSREISGRQAGICCSRFSRSFCGLPVIASTARSMPRVWSPRLPQFELLLLILSIYALVFMKEKTASIDKGFESGADKYAAYLETPEGRLRLDLAFANLQDFLPQPVASLCTLDLGSGPGAIGVRLARLGLSVTLLDVSLPMLDLAKRAAQEAGVTERIALKQGDATQLADLFQPGSFGLILCHNVLEFVNDPGAVLRSAARILRGPFGVLSVLVRNQPGEVLKAALLNGDMAAAERNLDAGWGDESLYGGKVRLFTRDSLRLLLAAASLELVAERGVRVISDYLPATISRNGNYEQIFELERQLGKRPEFAAMARYTHCLARRTDPIMQAPS